MDEGHADAARQAAEDARAVATGARDAAAAAQAALDAVNNAKAAADSAASAGNNAAAAAQASADAASLASNAGADAAKARQAAATAKANAARANRAAAAAGAFAATAANAATVARDAANRAADDAEAAAAAAEDAAAHAGHAVDAANEATTHANAATAAAQAAIDAAEQAQQVYDAARAADAERIATEQEQNDQLAQAASAAAAQVVAKDKWEATQAQLRDAETNRLIAEANDPATDPARVLVDARKVALALAQTGGPWTQAAAYNALSGSDTVAVLFVRTGIAEAAGQDDRTTLRSLAETGTDGFKAAVQAALAGTDADVAAFLRTQDYPGRGTDDRIAVDQVLAAAQDAHNTTLQQAAQKALDAGDDASLRQFLSTRQYTAAATDERIKVNQILAADTSGPELKAAAQVALDGTAGMLHQFLAVEQYTAAQRDQDSATHNNAVAGLLAQASQAAVTASQNANEAQATAATAREQATLATSYSEQAGKDATQAGIYANQAHQSAVEAQDSATQAAQSATTARAAANSAQQSAEQAARSSTWATASANQAARFAADAYDSAHHAYVSSYNAHQDADAAAAAAQQALHAAQQKVDDARTAEAFEQAQYCQQYQAVPQAYTDCIHMITASDYDKATTMLANGSMCELLYQQGTDLHKACLSDVLSPTFKIDQNLTLATVTVNASTQFLLGMLSIELAGLCGAFEPCGLLAMSIIPEGTAFTSWMGIAALDALATTRIQAILERSMVEDEASAAQLAESATNLFRNCGTTTPNSFTGDTGVLMADGSTKLIAQVTPNDQVLASSPYAAGSAAGTVSKVIAGSGTKNLADVEISTSTGVSIIQATSNHPFWVRGLESWVDAGDLNPGERLRTADGREAVVLDVRLHDEKLTVYNLTVNHLHTYYVRGGDTAVLVHNDGCWFTDDPSGPGIWSFAFSELGLLKSSPQSAAYQTRITGAPVGLVYRAGGYNFDGYKGGFLLDAKANYNQFIQSDGKFIGFINAYFIDAARKQLDAAAGTPIRWIFMQPESAALVRQLLADNDIVGIDIAVIP
ncbi:polymorphic toxin-type HINT domain-containing protein [Amycolatopsis pigmentata]|uniref:Polymorphic toxin-type HINT domain-containing protein n=1 Tax=Amycolatopsis pigmentata TaxID=450801 RepID=A0ABW5G551_9PSEU